MIDFDLALSVDAPSVARILQAIHGRPTFRQKIFRGSAPVSIQDFSGDVEWDVLDAPTVSLEPPSDAQWSASIGREAGAPRPTESSFAVRFPRLRVAFGDKEAVVVADVLCIAAIVENNLALVPLAVVVDLSTALHADRVLYRKVVIPKVLGLARTILAPQRLPNIQFGGVSFGAPALAVSAGRIVVAANLEGKPPPATPNPADIVAAGFSVWIGRETLQRCADLGASALAGKTADTSGAQQFDMGWGVTATASYQTGVRLDGAAASPSPSDPTLMDARVAVSAHASAGVQISPVPEVGLNYGAEVIPSPVGAQIGLGFSGATLRATVRSVADFVVKLTPGGGVAEWITSAIAWPLAQTMGILLPPLAKDLLRGISFDVLAIEAMRHTVEGEQLTVTPGNLEMGARGDMLVVQGTFEIG